jgi:hypothetical protein
MKEVVALFETLNLVRKGSEDDFELRSSEDEKVWGVRAFSDSPSKPTYAIFAGPDAKENACDLADYDIDDDDDEDGEDEDDDE